MSVDGLRAAEDKMRAAGVPDPAVIVFRHYYQLLARGETGLLPESDLEPVERLPTLGDLPDDQAAAREALSRTAVIKLNGGLGTSMGMEHAKSLLAVKNGQSFLDLIVRQVLTLRARHEVALPLVLMNSFSTREHTLAALSRHPGLAIDGIPLDFLQNQEPKLRADDLTPVSWPDDPHLEWCPPGHGDLFTALVTSGTLAVLLDRGFRYVFISNADNLGASPDPRIAEWFAAENIPFLMEACERTPADRKGGHLALRRATGRLVLRESAQTPDDDDEWFGDITRHRYFNTNNIWVDLRRLSDLLTEQGAWLGLAPIVNHKTVDPQDPASPAVIQLETAIGAAIEVFAGARAVCVDRSRFRPVKTTNDLLALRSDAYVGTDDGRVILSPRHNKRAPFVDLDPRHYRTLRDLDARFPAGPPSLVACERLVVRGDVTFGANVVARGVVELDYRAAPARIPDGTVLEGVTTARRAAF
jgi:UTP--glucose-1-phosphate uridylyltransferase